jgi:hypothetical protein
LKYVLIVAAAVALMSGVATANDTASSRKPYTLVQGQDIYAFAQDGNHIAWLGYARPCHHAVKLRNLVTGKTVYLTRRGGPTCRIMVEGSPGQMVLAGSRALWSWESPGGNDQWAYDLIAASPTMREAEVTHFSAIRPEERNTSPPPVPMAGENNTLVFAGMYGVDDKDTRAQIVLGNRAVPVNTYGGSTRDTVMIDVTKVFYGKPDRFVILRVTKWSGPRDDEPRTRPIAWEVRTMKRNGATWAKFDVDEPVRALAAKTQISGTKIALLTDDHIQIRWATGLRGRPVPVPKNTAPELGFAGPWVVFRTGRTIRVLDLRTGRVSVLTVADGRARGLSITRRPVDRGYRVAWIEERGEGRDRVRAIDLPRT